MKTHSHFKANSRAKPHRTQRKRHSIARPARKIATRASPISKLAHNSKLTSAAPSQSTHSFRSISTRQPSQAASLWGNFQSSTNLFRTPSVHTPFSRSFALTSGASNLKQVVPLHSNSLRSISTTDDLTNIDKQYKRVLFHAEQRGWLELDLICGSFVKSHKEQLQNQKSLDELTSILTLENSDLIRWLVEAHPIPDEWKNNAVLISMLEYAYSPNKPWYPQSGNQ